MDYFIDLFTGTTWAEFRKAGARVSGFNATMRGFTKNVKPGDILLCYLTGVMHWVGALEVIGPSNDKTRIWKDAEFPLRFDVKPLILLEPEHGLPMSELQGKVSFFRGPEDRGKYDGFVRGSPNRFKHTADGKLIHDWLQKLERNPIKRTVDARKLARTPLFRAERQKGKSKIPTVVTVPESEEMIEVPAERESTSKACTTRHTEIQFQLLQLGSDMGFELWVARNDRSRKWNGMPLGEIPGIVMELPTQFNEATNRTIELIDVLWLKGNSIVSAFEVECTTSIYSGLLRMSDLLALQPNIEIKLFLVAPDDRAEKVEQEILRPTFTLREKPLSRICGFLSFSKLMTKLEGIRKLGLARSLKPDFLDSTAEYFGEEDSSQ